MALPDRRPKGSVLPERRALPHEPRLDGLPVPGFVSQNLFEQLGRERVGRPVLVVDIANPWSNRRERGGFLEVICVVSTMRRGMVVQALPLHHEPKRHEETRSFLLTVPSTQDAGQRPQQATILVAATPAASPRPRTTVGAAPRLVRLGQSRQFRAQRFQSRNPRPGADIARLLHCWIPPVSMRSDPLDSVYSSSNTSLSAMLADVRTAGRVTFRAIMNSRSPAISVSFRTSIRPARSPFRNRRIESSENRVSEAGFRNSSSDSPASCTNV